MISLKDVMGTRYTLKDWAGYWLIMLVLSVINVSLQFNDTFETYPKPIFLPAIVKTPSEWYFIIVSKLFCPSDC